MKGFVLEWYPGYPDSNESTGILACATAQELVDECARLGHMYGDQVILTVKEVDEDEDYYINRAIRDRLPALLRMVDLNALVQAAVANARAQMIYDGPGVGKTCFLPTDDEVPS